MHTHTYTKNTSKPCSVSMEGAKPILGRRAITADAPLKSEGPGTAATMVAGTFSRIAPCSCVKWILYPSEGHPHESRSHRTPICHMTCALLLCDMTPSYVRRALSWWNECLIHPKRAIIVALLLWVLCNFTGFALLVWGRSKKKVIPHMNRERYRERYSHDHWRDFFIRQHTSNGHHHASGSHLTHICDKKSHMFDMTLCRSLRLCDMTPYTSEETWLLIRQKRHDSLYVRRALSTITG